MATKGADVGGDGIIKPTKKFRSSSKISGAYDMELSDILSSGHKNLPPGGTGANSGASGVITVPQGYKRQISTTDVIRRSNAHLLSMSEIEVVENIVSQRQSSDASVVSAPHKKSSTDFHDDGFVFNHTGLTSAHAAELLAKYGRNELAEKSIPLWYVFLEQLWQPMPLMIWAAVIVEIALGNYIDMGILTAIQFINASIGFYEIAKAGDAVAALKASLKPVATVKRDGKFQNIDAAEVVPGDLVLLACGSAVPADCRVNPHPPASGEAAVAARNPPSIDVDQAALTGESLPVTMHAGDSCKMGSTVVKGEEEGTVEFTGGNTFFGKTASLLQSEPELSNIQKILIKVVIALTMLSAVLCTVVFVYLALNEPITVALDFTVVLLVASIPMAMEIVTTTTLSLGSKELSSHGAIVARLAAIEDMAGMSILCSDKTGTLTLNKMVIQEFTPVYKKDQTQYTLLRYAAMAAKWMEPPRDALDTLTLTAADLDSLQSVTQLAYSPFDPVIKRTEGTIKDNSTGEVYKVSKGAPHILLKLVKEQQGYVLPADVHDQIEKDVLALGEKGVRCLAVAKTNADGKWEMLGLLTFLDPPRPDTKKVSCCATAVLCVFC
jgi:H+-transporting ATPase